MTPHDLAQRLSALDWSTCSLQHQLAISCAVETLQQEAGLCARRGPQPANHCGETKNCAPHGDNVIALFPARCRTVALLRLDGTPFLSKRFQPGPPAAPWWWIVDTVATELQVSPASVSYIDPNLVTVDGLPVYSVDFPF